MYAPKWHFLFLKHSDRISSSLSWTSPISLLSLSCSFLCVRYLLPHRMSQPPPPPMCRPRRCRLSTTLPPMTRCSPRRRSMLAPSALALRQHKSCDTDGGSRVLQLKEASRRYSIAQELLHCRAGPLSSWLWIVVTLCTLHLLAVWATSSKLDRSTTQAHISRLFCVTGHV